MNKKKKTYIDSKFSEFSLVPALLDKELQEKINRLVEEKTKLLQQEIRAVIEQHKDPQLPVSLFKTKSSILEIVVKYLHDIEKRNFSNIAALLQRDPRTIWHAYQRSVRKNAQLTILDTAIRVPVSLFRNRHYAPLEVVTAYLKDVSNLSFAEMSKLLQRSPKTLWTVYHRKKKKDEN